MRILFGTQTGTAMGFAQLLGKLARAKKWRAVVQDLEDFDPELLHREPGVVVFVQATFGKGEPTANARRLFDWLMAPEREALAEQNGLSRLNFAVFGLGMSQTYPERYQAAAKLLDKRLQELGARRVIERGEGDDNGDIESDFDKWEEALWLKLDEACPDTTGSSGMTSHTGTTSATAAELRSSAAASPLDQGHRVQFLSRGEYSEPLEVARIFESTKLVTPRNPYPALVTERRELHTPLSNRSCKHIELDVSTAVHSQLLTYATGDYLGVYVENDEEVVRRYAARLNVGLADVFVVQAAASQASGGTSSQSLEGCPVTPCSASPCTVRSFLTHHADLSGPLKRAHLRTLATFAKDSKEQETLLNLANPANNDMYSEKLAYGRVNMLDILEAFKSIDIPFHEFVDTVPTLNPRFYSIASSPNVHPNSIHLAVGFNQYLASPFTASMQALPRLLRNGVASDFLCRRLQVGEACKVYVKESLFKLPDDPTTPIVMIAAGTGLAPLMGFLEERVFQRKRRHMPVGRNILFFGCCDRRKDYIYEAELKAAVGAGDLLLYNAFSHEQRELVFVQHKLAEQSEMIYQLLRKEKAHLYVCGANAMAKGVMEAVLGVLQRGGLSAKESEEYVAELKADNRYQEDLFG